MSHRVAPLLLLLAASTFATGPSRPPSQSPPPVTVHEWGTFTSVAGEDGRAQEWVPRQAPSELPCFVERLPLSVKGYLPGTVRMETPVLYFYAPTATVVDVNVRFPRGVVTEWYPRASVTPAVLDLGAYRRPQFESSISWPRVAVSPAATPAFPTESAPSHYYPARETDAAPVLAGSQAEKFLFYRGVGLFAPPIEARISGDGQVAVRSSSGAPIGDLLYFVNDGGRIGYRFYQGSTGVLTLDPPALEEEEGATSPESELERLLVGRGLYPKEAAAMVKTWRDSWFEQGRRLFYLMPAGMVDAVLPLTIRPAPVSIVRAFVGRIELVTPAAVEGLMTALVGGDATAIRSYGRFLQPVADRVLAPLTEQQRAPFEQRLSSAYADWVGAPATCR